jgi:type I restriction enzyme S subunit
MYEYIGAEHWTNISLYDVANWKNGLAFKNIDFSESGHPVIKIAELKNGITEQTKFTDSKYSEDVFIKRGDMVFAWSGSPQTSIDTFRWDGVNGWLNQHIFKVTPYDFISDQFLFFLLKSLRPRFVQIALNKQTTGLGHVTVADLKEMRVGIPNRSEQRSIVNIISPLHEKIENNRRMNETLEEMARAIFKSWFVNFDPVHAKAADNEPAHMDADTAALFPSSFGDDGLPIAWQEGLISDIAHLNKATLKPSDFENDYIEHYSLPAFDAGKFPAIDFGGNVKSNKTIVPPKSVLLSKLNPNIERVWLPIFNTDYSTVSSTEFLVLTEKGISTRNFLYSFFCSRSFIVRFEGLVTGTSKSHQRVRPQMLLDMKVTIPSSKLINAFSSYTDSMFAKIIANQKENQTLTELRDTLLPKLMSSEIRVADAVREVEAAT